MNSSYLNESEQNKANAIIYDTSYDNLTHEQRIKLINKVDNFLEALYLAPSLFDRNVMKLLKYRENQLTIWRHTSQLIGGVGFLSVYAYYKIFRSKGGFFFRNFCYLAFSTAFISYFAGRFGEYIGNKFYYEKILFKLAATYNITEDEVEELQFKINEDILKENKEEQTRKGTSLDNVKFRV